MAYNARHYLLERGAIDPGLRDFVDDLEKNGFGEDLDNRAGTPYKPLLFFGTDEDALEGKALPVPGGGCYFDEIPCFYRCSIDHFHPALEIPFAGEDALVHAKRYFDWAVRLYKGGICRPLERDKYHRWAARSLGHAIHLVHDMGSPQHVGPENHAPIWTGGDGESFHEQWSLELWDKDATYTRKDGTSFHLGFFERSAALASTPSPGTFRNIMGSLASEAGAFPDVSPYHCGVELDLTQSLGRPGLLQVLAPSGFTARDFHWVEIPDPPYSKDSLQWFETKFFPPYGQGATSRRQRHLLGHAFLQKGEMHQPDMGAIQINSMNFSERLWAEPNEGNGDGNNPLRFDAGLKLLLTHTTEAAAGAILAFWDEVKGYSCQCEDQDPCGSGARPVGASAAGVKAPTTRAAGAMSCPVRPPVRPYTPGGDNPDDTQGIVSNVSAVKTASVAQFDSVELGRHWRQIAAVGVEKGLPSLVDFGRTMRLLELAQDQTLTDTGKDEIARGMAEMERKYSVRRPRPEDDMAKAAHIGVLENGFAGEAASALDALGWTHVTVPITFDPLQLAEDQKVLLIPSGGLYGTSGSADLKERLRERSTAQQITSPKQPVAAALT